METIEKMVQSKDTIYNKKGELIRWAVGEEWLRWEQWEQGLVEVWLSCEGIMGGMWRVEHSPLIISLIHTYWSPTICWATFSGWEILQRTRDKGSLCSRYSGGEKILSRNWLWQDTHNLMFTCTYRKGRDLFFLFCCLSPEPWRFSFMMTSRISLGFVAFALQTRSFLS